MTNPAPLEFDPQNYPRTYKISKEMRLTSLAPGIVFTFFGVVFLIGGLIKFGDFSFLSGKDGLALLSLILGIWCLCAGFGIRLTLHPNAVEYRRFLFRRLLKREDILTIRWVGSAHAEPCIVFVSKNPQAKSLNIVAGYEEDEFYDAWMSSIPYIKLTDYDPPADQVVWNEKEHMWSIRRG